MGGWKGDNNDREALASPIKKLKTENELIGDGVKVIPPDDDQTNSNDGDNDSETESEHES